MYNKETRKGHPQRELRIIKGNVNAKVTRDVSEAEIKREYTVEE